MNIFKDGDYLDGALLASELIKALVLNPYSANFLQLFLKKSDLFSNMNMLTKMVFQTIVQINRVVHTSMNCINESRAQGLDIIKNIRNNQIQIMHF